MNVFYAKWLLDPAGNIVENGAVAVEGAFITSAGPRSQVRRGVQDRIVNLGDMLLLPGLINMHSHLEESVVRGFAKEDDETFSSWMAKKVSRMKQASLETMLPAIRLGVRELLTVGTTTIVDSTRNGVSIPVLKDEPIRAWVVQEVHDDDDTHVEALDRLLGVRTRVMTGSDRIRPGIGPHALFSLSPLAHKSVIQAARHEECIWVSHLAESAEELQAFSEQKGDLYFQISRKRGWQYGASTMGSMYYAITQNLIPNGAILIHCNYVNGQELALLAAKNVSIVLCPHYSRLLGHKDFPLDVALSRGVSICLGTENPPDLGSTNLFDEMHLIKSNYPHIPAKELLRWATQNPARALKSADRLGNIAPGMLADMIGVSFAHDPNEDLLEELMMEYPDIRFVMVNGEEVIADY